MRLKTGDHVPHVFDLPTAGAFDFKGDCRSFRQQPPAVAAPNLFFNPSHSLKVLSCAPEHRLIAFARPSLWALNRRRKPCTMITASCGAVVRRIAAGPVGEAPISPASAENSMPVGLPGLRAVTSAATNSSYLLRFYRPRARRIVWAFPREALLLRQITKSLPVRQQRGIVFPGYRSFDIPCGLFLMPFDKPCRRVKAAVTLGTDACDAGFQ